MGIAILAEGSPHPVEVSFIGAETVRQSLNLRAADSMLLGLLISAALVFGYLAFRLVFAAMS